MQKYRNRESCMILKINLNVQSVWIFKFAKKVFLILNCKPTLKIHSKNFFKFQLKNFFLCLCILFYICKDILHVRMIPKYYVFNLIHVWFSDITLNGNCNFKNPHLYCLSMGIFIAPSSTRMALHRGLKIIFINKYAK